MKHSGEVRFSGDERMAGSVFHDGLPIFRQRTLASRRIVIMHGLWWFCDADANRIVRLDNLFADCGWNVARLSRLLGLGTRTFSRITEESLGISAKAWLRQIRIVRASHLLREGHKIEIVSQTLGFRHKSDFTNEFRSLFKITPSAYAKSELMRIYAPHARDRGRGNAC